MGHHTDVFAALAERERAARELSETPAEQATPAVEEKYERQPEDVVMSGWLSAWLVSYWLRNGVKRTSTGAGAGG
jgi:hypothetical protein